MRQKGIQEGIICQANYQAQINRDFFNEKSYPFYAPVSKGGRNAAYFVEGELFSGVLRHYQRGGLIAKLVKNHYFWLGEEKTRSWQEYAIMDYLYQEGVRVPQPIAAYYQRQGLSYTASIITQRLPKAITLVECLEKEGYDNAKLAQEVAEVVLSLHDKQVFHADLNGFNILIDEDGKAYLIDFDKSARITMTEQYRKQNLDRLERHLNKVLGEKGLVFMRHIREIYRNLSKTF